MFTVQTKRGVKVTLREPLESDAKEIIDFYNEVGGETNFLSFEKGEYKVSLKEQENTINYVNDSINNTMILALYNSKIIGIGSIVSNQKKKGKHVGSLGIAIKEEYCNMGLGRIIMEYLIDWCKENKITTKINLSVREDNPRAIALYKKCGFEVEGISKNETYLDGKFFDLVNMGLIL